jgi:hypothetical protein
MSDQPAPLPVDPWQERVDAIRARVEAATPGPWRCSNRGDGSASVYRHDDDFGDEALVDDGLCPHIRGEVRAADGPFIAHAREDIPWLLNQLEALEAQHQQQIAELHDLLASFNAVTDPEAFCELNAQANRVLGAESPDGDCGNQLCHTISEFQQQIASKEAEIARLTQALRDVQR